MQFSRITKLLPRDVFALLVALIAMEIFLPTGCIGFQAIVGKKRIEPKHRLETRVGIPGAMWGPDTISTRADALRVWGEPNRRIMLSGGREVWKYQQKEMRWRGVLIWAVIVPAPLLVPTGRGKLWLEFNNDSLTQVINQSTDDKCYGLFLFEPMAGKSMSTLLRH